MTLEERVLDISGRLARELGKDRENIAEIRIQYADELDAERKQWSKELEDKRKLVDKESCSLGHAKTRIHAVASQVDDEVLALNVGGHVFASRRSTLCLYEGTYLANLFSGRWEASIERDTEGRFFLDFDPGSFRLLLNFLRSKRLESPIAPLPPPDIPANLQERFQNLVEYLGLTEVLQEAQEASDAYVASLGGDKAEAPPPLGASLLNSASNLITALRTTALQAATDTSAAAVATAAAAERRAVAATTAATAALQPQPPPNQAPAMATEHGGVGARSQLPVTAPHASSSSSSSAPRWGQHEQRLSHSGAVASTASGVEPEPADIDKRPGWSRKMAHERAVIDADDPMRMRIGDTRALAAAAAVRSTRGFQAGKHSFEIMVEVCSDWSYVGFVSQTWSSTSHPIGRSINSWGVASNGMAYAGKQEVKELQRFSSGSQVVFVLDMDAPQRSVTVIINGKEFPDVFTELPAPLYPAVSNCRSPARYYLNFSEIGLSDSLQPSFS